ncbi:hypothetical protein VKT23_014905 [Stygiomarasmius scandens]|uniref:Glucose-methanol-choline oxidoreductase N-terminal domain-containing protein n=1 Tax=Marasmiellus scandens TaxID=2682957 RepID=A0ABR1IZU1_9AGAR
MSLLFSIVLLASSRFFGLSAAFPPPDNCDDLPFPPSEADIQGFLSNDFDFIVVGGGTAGITIGARLAEAGNIVGVIEAGPFHRVDDLVDIPGLWQRNYGNGSYDWNFEMAPQVHANNRSVAMPRGRMLGGSSAINGMAWNRASIAEYDAWQTFALENEWSWDGLLPFFTKSENVSTVTPDPFPGITEEQREAAAMNFPNIAGISGPLDASHQIWYPDTMEPYVKALNSMGILTNADAQGGNTSGVYNTLSAIRRPDSKRSYSARQYYCQGVGGSNIHVITGATVSRIHFSGAPDRDGNIIANGVEFIVEDQSFAVNATREIIVSAGPVKSSQVLELSGIGNPEILSQFGIETVVELPGVGENFQEHVWAGVQWELVDGVTTFDILNNNVTFAEAALAEYRTQGTGPYSATDAALTFVWNQDVSGAKRQEELLTLFDQVVDQAPSNSLRALQYPIQRKWFAEGTVRSQEVIQLSMGAFDVEEGKSYVFALGGSIHPLARGTLVSFKISSVHIRSADPLDQPNIDPNFLGTEFDIQLNLDNVKFIQTIGRQAPFSNLIARQTHPSPDQQSDEQLLEWIRSTASSGGHLIGSNAMAPRENQGVVDSSLKVYGTTNLRVIDASIFPLPIGHTQATVYAIAEKAAGFILGN